MSYTKIIQSGTLIEIYEYEKEPNPPRIRKKSRRGNAYRQRRARNVGRARKSFFRIVRANVKPTKRPALLTLTMREIKTLKESWRAATLFFQRLKRLKYPQETAFVVVPEYQRRGAVHFHALIWGLSDDEIESERNTRSIAKLWGEGFIDIVTTDGSPKLATYMAKYMSKAMSDSRSFGQKSYSASRNLVRPVSFTSGIAIDTIQRELRGDRLLADGTWQVGVDNSVDMLTEDKYNTAWLGRCRRSVYELK